MKFRQCRKVGSQELHMGGGLSKSGFFHLPPTSSVIIMDNTVLYYYTDNANYIICKTKDKQSILCGCSSKEDFNKYFVDIQKERKAKLKKLFK